MLRARVSRRRLTSDSDEAPAEPSPAAPKKAKPRAGALSAEALVPLGAPRLAELLMVQAKADPALARALRLVLAGSDGSGRLALAVEKRLRTIQRSRGYIEWDKVRPLARELDGLRGTIEGQLAATDPRAAVAQMRLLLGLADGVLERSNDGSGALGDVFHQAASALGRLWSLLPDRDPVALAGEVLALLDADAWGTTGGLLAAAGPALGPDGRAALRRVLQARVTQRPQPRGEHGFAGQQGRFRVSMLLGELADLDGDADAYIAAMVGTGRAEQFAAEIGARLIAQNRPDEALAWLDRAPNHHEDDEDRHEGSESRIVDLRVAALDALGRQADAQALRWAWFKTRLSVPHLRAYLRALPDFDDVEAEDRAMAHALSHPNRTLALGFLAAWPKLDAANQLVRAHVAGMDGGAYAVLRPAAEALAERYPAAATLLYRALTEDVLRRASSRQYPYAARDARAASALAPTVPDEPGLESHAVFMARLRRDHKRKAGFWQLLDPSAS